MSSNIVKQMLSIVPSGKIEEIQTTSTTAANPVTGVPAIPVTKDHVLKHAKIIEGFNEVWVAMGLALDGDITLVTPSQVASTDNQIRHNDVVYDIVGERIRRSYVGTYYVYLLRRTDRGNE